MVETKPEFTMKAISNVSDFHFFPIHHIVFLCEIKDLQSISLEQPCYNFYKVSILYWYVDFQTLWRYVKYGYINVWYRERSAKFLALFMALIALEILPVIYETCAIQFNFSSIITPRNLVTDSCVICLPWRHNSTLEYPLLFQTTCMMYYQYSVQIY